MSKSGTWEDWQRCCAERALPHKIYVDFNPGRMAQISEWCRKQMKRPWDMDLNPDGVWRSFWAEPERHWQRVYLFGRGEDATLFRLRWS